MRPLRQLVLAALLPSFFAPAVPATVQVFDLRGRLVREIYRGQPRGSVMPLAWDLRDGRGQDVASGVYLVRAQSGVEARSLKLAVVR
jgi:hypothetical protein